MASEAVQCHNVSSYEALPSENKTRRILIKENVLTEPPDRELIQESWVKAHDANKVVCTICMSLGRHATHNSE